MPFCCRERIKIDVLFIACVHRLLSSGTVSLTLDPTAALRLRSPLLPCRGWQGFREETADCIYGKTKIKKAADNRLSVASS